MIFVADNYELSCLVPLKESQNFKIKFNTQQIQSIRSQRSSVDKAIEQAEEKENHSDIKLDTHVVWNQTEYVFVSREKFLEMECRHF